MHYRGCTGSTWWSICPENSYILYIYSKTVMPFYFLLNSIWGIAAWGSETRPIGYQSRHWVGKEWLIWRASPAWDLELNGVIKVLPKVFGSEANASCTGHKFWFQLCCLLNSKEKYSIQSLTIDHPMVDKWFMGFWQIGNELHWAMVHDQAVHLGLYPGKDRRGHVLSIQVGSIRLICATFGCELDGQENCWWTYFGLFFPQSDVFVGFWSITLTETQAVS